MSLKQEVLDALLLLATQGPTQPEYGICCSVIEYHTRATPGMTSDDRMNVENQIDDLLNQLMLKWPKHSRREAYPIADPSGHKTPSEYFWSKGEKWDLNTEQGQLRLELLNFTIAQLQIQLSKT